MGDLVIKPEAGGSIKLQNNAGTNALVSDNSGNVTLAGTLTGGTISSAVTFPTGHVLQVVTLQTTTQGSISTSTSADTLVTGMTKDITPKGTGSYFLVTVRWTGEVASVWDIVFNIQMDGVRCNSPASAFKAGLSIPVSTYGAGDDSTTPEATFFSTLVSTSSVIGTDITFRLVASGSAQTMWTNRCFDPSGQEYFSSELIITEIKG